MVVSIESMNESHLEEVAELENKNFTMPWSINAFRDTIYSTDYKYIVAVFEEHVVGYAGMQHVLDEAEITNIAVDEKMRRLGVATTLLEGLRTGWCRYDIKYLHLEVRESNYPARKLYEKNGFEIDGMRKNFYQKPQENAVLMTKKL